jgi:hypothetical protein
MAGRGQLGSQTRRQFLQKLQEMSQKGQAVLGVASVQELVESATDLSLPRYLEHMRTPDPTDRNTWGGFLEASLIAMLWRCKVVIFAWNEPLQEGPVMHVLFGSDHGDQTHQHGGIIAVLWWGGHYDALILSADVLSRLQ